MTTEKRKSHTSTAVKRRYNEKVYTRITFSAPKKRTAAFKEKCIQEDISQAQIFKEVMRAFLEKRIFSKLSKFATGFYFLERNR